MLMLYLHLALDGLVTGCAVGLVAMSFSYYYATSGNFHIAHAGVFTISGYVALALTEMGLPFAVAFAGAVVFSALVGMAIQAQLYDRLRRRGASDLVVLIASIGLLAVLQNIVAIVFTPNTIHFDLEWRQSVITFGDIFLSVPQLLILVMSVILLAGLILFSRYAPMGKRIRAVASNPELAEITHLNPRLVIVVVMGIASAIVAVPGVLIGLDQAMQPYSSLLILLTAVVAVISGGIGSPSGAFLMSILLAMVQSLSFAFVSGRWSIAIVFAVFVVFILLRPQGLFQHRTQRSI